MDATTARRKTAELLWLLHYNRVLLKQGLITVEEYRQMESMIRTRKHIPTAEYPRTQRAATISR